MEKQVHDPSRNVDRAPSHEQRVGNQKVDRDAQHDREMQENVDKTIEDSFPASDPPSWNAGSSVVQDEDEDEDEDEEKGLEGPGERSQDRSAAARVAERNRSRSRTVSASERSRTPTSQRQALAHHQLGDEHGEPSQREQTGVADRTPEQRDTNAIGTGPRFEDLDPQVLAEQDKPHLKPEHTDDRTDLPGRRAAPQGPHQAFPGESPASRQPRH